MGLCRLQTAMCASVSNLSYELCGLDDSIFPYSNIGRACLCLDKCLKNIEELCKEDAKLHDYLIHSTIKEAIKLVNRLLKLGALLKTSDRDQLTSFRCKFNKLKPLFETYAEVDDAKVKELEECNRIFIDK